MVTRSLAPEPEQAPGRDNFKGIYLDQERRKDAGRCRFGGLCLDRSQTRLDPILYILKIRPMAQTSVQTAKKNAGVTMKNACW